MAISDVFNFRHANLSARMLATACLAGFFGYSIFKYYNSSKKSNKQQLTTDNKTTDAKTPLQLKKLGNDHYIKGNHEQAIVYYTQAIELCEKEKTVTPTDLATFYQNRAAAYDVLNKHEECLNDCTAAIEHNKKYVKAFVRRAKCYEKMNQYENAIGDATTACVLDEFQNQDTLLLTDRLLKASSKIKAAKAMETYKPRWPPYSILKGFFASFCQDPIYRKCATVKIDDLKRLYAEAEEFLDKNKGNTKIQISVGGDTPEPNLENLEGAKVSNNSDYIDVDREEYYFHLIVKATCKSLMGEAVLAEEILDQLIKSEDCSPSIKSNALLKKAANSIASLANQENAEIDPILTIYAEAIKLQPDNPDIYLHRAQTYTLGDKLEEAKKDLDKATELNPKFSAAVAQKYYVDFRLSTREGNMQVVQESLNKFKAAAKESPNSLDLQQSYAQALMDIGEFEAADELFRKVLSKDPQDGILAATLAMLHVQWQNNPVKAIELLKEAIRVDPKSKFPYEILASIEIQRGKVDEAIKLFEQALDCARSEFEFANIYSSLDAAKAQKTAFENLGSQI